MIYSERLKELREEKELTQKDLSDLLQIHAATYSQFERESSIIPIKRLNALANFFNVSIDYLFEFTNNKQYNNHQKEINLKLSGQRLKEIRKINKFTQEKLANYLNTTQSNIVGYEKGLFPIATPYIYMICQKFKVRSDYLLGKIDEPKYLK